MLEAGRSHLGAGQLILVGGRVRVGRGDGAVQQPALHRRARFDGQAVEADVFDGQPKRGGQCVRPRRHALPRQTVDEIDVEIVEAGGAGHVNGGDSRGEVVLTAEQGQFLR